MTCLMLGFKNQVFGNYGMMVHVYFLEFICCFLQSLAYFLLLSAFLSRSK